MSNPELQRHCDEEYAHESSQQARDFVTDWRVPSLERMLIEYCGFKRTLRFGYVPGKSVFGDKLGFALAQRIPTLLSEAALIAYH